MHSTNWWVFTISAENYNVYSTADYYKHHKSNNTTGYITWYKNVYQKNKVTFWCCEPYSNFIAYTSDLHVVTMDIQHLSHCGTKDRYPNTVESKTHTPAARLQFASLQRILQTTWQPVASWGVQKRWTSLGITSKLYRGWTMSSKIALTSHKS